jgi:CHAT domain-containing protein/tetratricopeptide (TPR) repeat protein
MLCWAAGAGVLAETPPVGPPEPPAEKAPWQRMLTGDDAQRAAELEKKLGELGQADKFAEAQQVARQLVELRSRVQGANHWQTANARRIEDDLKRLERLPVEARAQLRDLEPLHKRWLDLRGAGKFQEALVVARQAVAICQKLLGEEHNDTIASYGLLASTLDDLFKFEEAERLHRRALALHRKLLGTEHPEMAWRCNNLAMNLNYQGKYAEAEPLFRQAVAVTRQVLGEAHPDMATRYNNLATNLDDQGKYAEAEPLYRRTLDLTRRLRGEEHPVTADVYSNLAENLKAQGKYIEAEPLHRHALAIHRKVLGEEQPHTADSYNNLALDLGLQGKYTEAEMLHRRALAIYRKVLGEDHPRTAMGYSNLAACFDARRLYADAEPLYRRVLAFRRKVLGEEHPDTARSYTDLASNLHLQGKYAEAETLDRQALAIQRKVVGEEHPDTARSSSNLADNLSVQGKHAEADRLYRRALAIWQKTVGEEHSFTTESYTNLGMNLNAQGEYAAAETMWRAAAKSYEAARLRITYSGLERATFSERSPLLFLAACLARRAKPAEAWQSWEADLARSLFDALCAGPDRPLTDKERRREQEFLDKLQLLDKQVAALGPRAAQNEDSRHQIEKLRGQRDALLAELSRFQDDLARRYGVPTGQVYDLARIQARLPADSALIGWLDIPAEPKAADANGEHWACIVRRRGDPAWVRLPGRGPRDSWTEADDQLPGKVREILIHQAPDATVPWRELPGQLYAQRLAPLAKHLGATADLPAVRQLIILPSPLLAGVPVEALMEARTDQQSEYTVSYAPSGTLFAWLQEQRAKHPRAERPRLLALGDPVFAAPKPTPPAPSPPAHGVLLTQVVPGSNAAQAGLRANDVLLTFAGQELSKPDDLPVAMSKARGAERIPVEVWRAGKTLSLTVLPGQLGVGLSKLPAAEALQAERDFVALMQRTRGPALSRLPGSRSEVEAIAGLFDQADTLLGSKASEQQLDAVTTSGRLKEYAYLHLATHGLIDVEVPLRSALALADDGLPDPLAQALAGKRAYDGRLTAEQILRTWKLDAEMVTLSACQTGLGKYQAGEGYLGFAQSLFVAGGRSVVLSLWQADDDATALLMIRFYQNMLGKRAGLDKPMSKAAALAEAKAWLRGLTNKELDKQLAKLPRGEVERKRPAAAEAGPRPFGHPYYWAAFILIGEPQ